MRPSGRRSGSTTRSTLGLTIVRFGRTSMTTSWAAAVGERPCVEGEIVHVFVDPATLSPLPVPDLAKERLAPHVAPS